MSAPIARPKSTPRPNNGEDCVTLERFDEELFKLLPLSRIESCSNPMFRLALVGVRVCRTSVIDTDEHRLYIYIYRVAFIIFIFPIAFGNVETRLYFCWRAIEIRCNQTFSGGLKPWPVRIRTQLVPK